MSKSVVMFPGDLFTDYILSFIFKLMIFSRLLITLALILKFILRECLFIKKHLDSAKFECKNNKAMIGPEMFCFNLGTKN